MASETNTVIMYQGGSGGFFLYYYLLLSGKYSAGHVGLSDKIDIPLVKQLISRQFNTPNKMVDWKKSEISQDINLLLESTTMLPKLILWCNPLYDYHSELIKNTVQLFKCTGIALYTDIHTQLRLSFDKKAHTFFDSNTSQAKRAALIDAHRTLRSTGILDNTVVDSRLLKFATLSDQPISYVKLQDVLHYGYGEENSDQREFVNYWISLHSPKAKRKLLSWQ